MENSDFKISKGKLKKYVGPGGDVVIPDGVTSIEREAFKGCKNLTSVVIPHGVTQIGTSAFEDCENLTDVSLPESVKTILGAAFKSCKKITNIHVPSSVTFIDGSVFASCSGLVSVYLPDSVTQLGSRSFECCDHLRKVRIPKYIGWISPMFYGCPELTAVSFESLEEMEEGVLRLPDSINTIEPHAFVGTKFKKAIIPNGVKELRAYTFGSCKCLEQVVLPESLEIIKSMAFYNCESLAEINLPSHLKEIESRAFEGCYSLPELLVPQSMQVLSESAFGIGAVRRLEMRMIGDFLVSNGVLLSYRGKDDSVVIPDGVVTIIAWAMTRTSPFQQITLPDSVRSIQKDAFSPGEWPGISAKEMRAKTLPCKMNMPEGYLKQEKGAFDTDLVVLLLDGPWKALATDDDYITMYLKQTSKPLLEKCKGYLSEHFSSVFEKLLQCLEADGDKTVCERVTSLALENHKNVSDSQWQRLYNFAVKKKSKKVMQMIEKNIGY